MHSGKKAPTCANGAVPNFTDQKTNLKQIAVGQASTMKSPAQSNGFPTLMANEPRFNVPIAAHILGMSSQVSILLRKTQGIVLIRCLWSLFLTRKSKKNCQQYICEELHMAKPENNTFAAKASNLRGLIGYQEGAVVSRTLIDKETGTVTLFAFDAGQGLSEHTAPFDAMVLVLEGAVEVKISGKPIMLREDEVTIMPANQPHALAAKIRVRMLLIMIKS
jgi:quercetin dioxygenase-like cupin family protein